MIWPAERLSRILRKECDRLVDEIVGLARQKGYADQTSSLRGAWTESTECLNLCLVGYLSGPQHHAGHDGHNDYRKDPRFDRLRQIAQTHHDAGVPLELHNGLFKLYRRVYLDHFSALLTLPGQDPEMMLEAPETFLVRIDEFFDEVELAMLAPWAATGPRDLALGESLRRLTRERDRYFAALESLRIPVFIATDSGQLVTANQAALQAFLDLSEAGALTYRLALQPHRVELQAIVDEILQTTGSQWDAIWMQTRSKGRCCFDIRVRVVEDASHKFESWQIILMHDVTEHHQAVRAARDAERTMSLFLAAMAHEIRGPLHSVLGAAGLLKGADPEESEKLVELLDSSARSLNTTLENVLNFSRFEHQAPQPRPDTVDLRAALGDLRQVKGILARQQGVPLRLEIAPEVPALVRLDWSMTQQVLSNLVQNALRHDDGRGVTISLETDAGALVFCIADHGPGLSDEICALLSSVPAELRPRATAKDGAGLGLAIAQRMTLALGGSIKALDADEGATIEVRLPLVATEATEPPRRSAPLDRRLDQSCLLVDDDPINALVTIAMLERLGLSVDHAHSIGQAQALCLAASQSYDLFILDYRLPDGTGADLARQLRRDPALRDAPILLLSANVDWVRQSPEDVGLFTALLDKPLDARALARAIQGATRPPAGLLDGLSPAVQRKMAAAFTESWSAFRPLLSNASPDGPDAAIAGHAHKLVSGAKIFGLAEIAAALQRLEGVHSDPAADAALRAAAHGAALACTLPADWADRLEGAPLT
ncbi:ATP-binding protein [Tropicimonas sp. IMCC34043]|uniref:hybrid sensor histidine kinase/response regulator n=1 Tax=Tropicimonas sp. IMCC34043 TaxID=2248760 RepID=UPI001E3CD900|nr:ATP-binding protein [Tropicimonas sp. IMCC34043]